MKKGLLFGGMAVIMAISVLTGCGSSAEKGDVEVARIEGIKDDFITGVDISSYVAEKESGVKFYDFDGKELDDPGFFKLLKDGGVNYVRVRIWNDPTDGEGHTYGGGNCDISVAKKIGKYATDAGMKVLLDFHYSDFWADPGKQTAPKAWQGMTNEEKSDALYEFTKTTLQECLDEGIDVGMVQVGNETTNGICGAKDSYKMMTDLFSAGSKAVRDTAKENNKDILVAIHYTDPQHGKYKDYADYLMRYEVDYDVFASSYYPYWHGTLENLTDQLKDIAEKYDKKGMVAETSYAYTLTDFDGSGNTESITKVNDEFNYDISAQGQIDEIRSVAEAVINCGDAGIGIFYWEPAWLPVGIYDENSADAASVLANNRKIWEEKGSGWATSYSVGYDKDAEGAYGGSAVDNEAWFTADGHPLPTVNAYKYIRTGAVLSNGKKRMASEEKPEPEEIESKLPGGAENLLKNPDFETKDDWEITNIDGKACAIENDKDNVLTGDYCLKFWDSNDFYFTASQTLTLDAGTYCLGGYFEGGDCGDNADISLLAAPSDPSDSTPEYTVKTSDEGWRNWQNPEIDNIEIENDGTKITVMISVKAKSGGWGAWDGMYLYKK